MHERLLLKTSVSVVTPPHDAGAPCLGTTALTHGRDEVRVPLKQRVCNILVRRRVVEIRSVQQSLAEVGVEIRIETPSLPDYLKRVFVDSDFDLAISFLAGYAIRYAFGIVI